MQEVWRYYRRVLHIFLVVVDDGVCIFIINGNF